jgi:electron transport complex protein RnfC
LYSLRRLYKRMPRRPMPTLIDLSSRREFWPEAKRYGALDCIECGICSYVCPVNIRLVQSIKRAKLELGR